MNLPELVQAVLTSRTMTPAMEDKINQVMWSQQLSKKDLDALGQLIAALEQGTVYSLSSEPQLQAV